MRCFLRTSISCFITAINCCIQIARIDDLDGEMAMRKRMMGKLALYLFLHATLLITARAQQQPGIRVSVHDEAGRPLAMTQVQLKLRGEVVGTATTNEEGVASFSLDLPGGYEITMSKPGFEPLTRSGVEV